MSPKINMKVNTTNFILLLLIIILLLIGSISYIWSNYVTAETPAGKAGTVSIEFSQTIYIPENTLTDLDKMDYRITNTHDEPVTINKYVFMTIHDKYGNEVNLNDYEDFIFLHHYSDIAKTTVLTDHNSIDYEIQGNIIKFDADKVIVHPDQQINRSYIIDITGQPKELDGSVLHFTLVLESLRRDYDGYYYSDLTIKTFTFQLNNEKLSYLQG